jgi:pimeloyl-ACP methyl ester carboxylesterase
MHYVSSKVDGLHYELIDLTQGSTAHPQTIIFHHGVGANSALWNRWIPVLSRQYRIVTFDMRGFGLSAQAARADGWTMESLANDVLHIADAVDTERFHLVGESIGGTIGLVVALNHTHRLRTLTMSNAAYRGGAIQNVGQWDQVLSEQGTLTWSQQMMAARFYKDGITPEQWQWFEAQQASHPIESIVVARNILVGADLGPRLAELNLPVLLMHGDASPFVPVQQMVELHQKLPNSELNIFGHAKHGLPFSHATECAKRLLSFIERQQQGSI